ncbi:MAG: M14 family metallopeptidase [Planctomycetota bacterium]
MKCLCIFFGLAILPAATWAAEGLKILSASEASATVDLTGTEGVVKGTCFEVRKGGALLGFLQATDVQGEKAECAVLAGKADPAATAIPILPQSKRIAFITDDPEGREAQELNALYPGLVTTDEDRFDQCGAMVCILSNPDKVRVFDFSTVRSFVEKGRVAVVSLNVYAAAKSAPIETVKRTRTLQIKVERGSDLTRGMAVGQTIDWYGAEKVEDDPKKTIKFHQTMTGLPDSERFKIVARSCDNNQAIFVEVTIGDGRIFALDLLSLNGNAGYDAGSKNKWVFPGNVLGRAVRYSRYRTEKLEYPKFVDLMSRIAQKHEGRIVMKDEGKGSDDDPTYSLFLGEPDAPRFLITGSLHGGEWKNSYALLDLVETLLENPYRDYKIDWLLKNFGIRIIPILNAAGYKKYGQVNKNNCDLNRNYPFHWEEYKGDGGWRAKYSAEELRGKAPFSEAESQIVRRIIEERKPLGLIDMHMHGFESGHMICCPHKEACADLKELQAIKLLIDQRLRDRYLFGVDKEGKVRQIQLRGGGYGGNRPFLINWAGTLGIHSTVFESVGGWEDSLPHGDVVVEDCLNFMCVVGANYMKIR